MRAINRTSRTTESVALALGQLPEHENLKQVMQWALADNTGSFIRGVVFRVVVQDEYTHDVIVPWRDGLVLVYDTT